MGDTRLEPIVLSAGERSMLQNWARRRSTAQGLAKRAAIVLACADGLSNTAVAARLETDRTTVGRWRTRFLADRLDGLSDEPRPGVPRTITDAQVEEVVAHAGGGAGGRNALVQAGVGPPGGYLAVQRAPHLAGVRAAAAPYRDVQDLPGPVAAGQDPGCGRALSGPRRRTLWSSTRNRRFRHWNEPRPCSRCCPASPSGAVSTTSGTAPLICSRRRTPPPGK
ncbi:helix-turn-helix domain-containing protein [Streptomyces sp. NPDC087903]|uniref:helix-turn-helix domain-containing protein n=1 Tax=Streptomyces sp. NPDC087903 TaxID=3365819 RepID=UPI0037FE8948